MTLRSLAGTTALVLSLTSSNLLADVTPEDVWQAWQNASTAMGTVVTSESAVRDGDTLVVTNIALGDGTGTKVTLETISFIDNGDGTVSIVLPDSFPIVVTLPATEGDANSTASALAIEVTMPGAAMTASGTAEAITWDTDAPQMDLKIVTSEIGSPHNIANIAVNLAGVAAHYAVTSGDTASYEESFSVKSSIISASGSDPATGSAFKFDATIGDLYNNVLASGPKDSSVDGIEAALANGLNMSTQFGIGATKFDLSTTDAGDTSTVSGTLKDGVVDVIVDATKVDYYHSVHGFALSIGSPMVPVADAKIGLAQTEVHVMVPLLKTDAPADFTFLFNLTDLSFAEDIWAMIDPGKAFKHDPATVVVDTFGQVTLAQDLSADAAAVTAADPNAVGQLNTLEVPKIHLKAGGAELTAQGSFTFDNSDLTTFAGIPAPTGKIDIKATGVNALIDTLVIMGLLPQDQADQGRMMLAMFANTSATADEITSTLEFKDKHFFANGQQLQ